MLVNYFRNVGWKRVLAMVFGNVFLGMGVAVFKLSGLGNDAYNAMVMALAEVVGIPYQHFFAMLSVTLFVIELLFGRNLIGVGTIVNTFFLGYIVTFFYNGFCAVFTVPVAFLPRVMIMCAGVITGGLGLSMYQTPDVGVSPYDSLSIILSQRLNRIPYFWCRMFTDALCALIGFLAGGLIGIGTLVAAFGFGPVIHFFNVHLTEKILGLPEGSGQGGKN